MSPERRDPLSRALRYVLGPWELLPVAAGVVLFVVSALHNLYISVLVPSSQHCYLVCIDAPSGLAPAALSNNANGLTGQQIDPLAIVLNAALVGLTVFAALRFWTRRFALIDDQIPTRTQYLVAIVTTAIAAAAVRLMVLDITPGSISETTFASAAIRLTVSLSLIHVLLGINNSRYRRARHIAVQNSERAEQALLTIKRQQGLIVEADERARRQIASFLHDHVQAGLLVAAMKLRQATRAVDESLQPLLNETIDELERMRSQDVRGASQRLSPGIDVAGIHAALSSLAETWRSVMAVHIAIDSNAREVLDDHNDSSATVATALYRLIEQGLLNSAAHGQATDVSVLIRKESTNITVALLDNGLGLSPLRKAGSGSALMDAWMETVGGSWSLEAGAVGTRLLATVPVPTTALA